jgi:hypothetical protein
MTGRRRVAIGLLLALYCFGAPVQFASQRSDLPERLANDEFWRLADELSEPGGFFNSDNLVSNEDTFQFVIPELVRIVEPGGVYVGVGPDQNFTYMAAVEPAIAFITDVRQGNRHVHLMYKALFALSANRREFLSRLFSRPAPAGEHDAPVGELLTALTGAPPDAAGYEANLAAVLGYLVRHRGEPLAPDDRDGIEFVMQQFFLGGPEMTFVSNGGFRRNRYPSFVALQTATDRAGVGHAYLSTEEKFHRIKRLQERNLVGPVVGNFGGPKALRAVGSWVRERGGVVTTFYTSNVEQYLFQDSAWGRFRANVASMPTDPTSTFIRSCFNNCSEPGGSRAVSLLDSVETLLESVAAGRIRSYWDVLMHSRQGE